MTGLASLEAVLRQVDTTSKNLQVQSTNLNSNLATLQSSSLGCSNDISNDPTWLAIKAGSAGLETSLASLAVGVSTTVTTLSDIVSAGSGQFVVSNLGRNVFAGAAAALGLYLAFLLLIGVTLLPKPCCATTFRVCNVVLLLVFLLTWIFSGVMLMVSVVGSDICVDVPGALGAIATQTTGTSQPVDAETITYYASCRRADGTVKSADASTDGAANDALQACGGVALLQTSFTTFVASQTPAWRTNCNANIAAVNANLADATTVAVTLCQNAACLVVNDVYQPIAAALCNTGIYAMTNVWVLATCCAIVIAVMTTAGVRLCWRHPGDPVDDDGDGESTRLTERWAKAGAAGSSAPRAPPRGNATATGVAGFAPASPYVVSNPVGSAAAAEQSTSAYGAQAYPSDWAKGAYRT